MVKTGKLTNIVQSEVVARIWEGSDPTDGVNELVVDTNDGELDNDDDDVRKGSQ